MAKKLQLKGRRASLSVVKIGGDVERVSSFVYNLPLVDRSGNIVNVNGIEKMSQPVQNIGINAIIHQFK